MSIKARVLLTIYGQVQGVFFRSKAQAEAKSLGLTGWIRNKDDGSVECLVEGDKDKLEEFINWCQQGPDQAKVAQVHTAWQIYINEFTDLIIK